jgi:predicted GNAT superfamily acetyltransferase
VATLLRPITSRDVAAVLALNEADVDLLAPMDAARLVQLREWAHRADVVLAGGEVAGFVLTFAPGTAYDSPNYRWFAQRYGTGFHYLDRIVLDPRFRRLGLGSAVYDAVERDAVHAGRLALEVNLEPPNEGSLAFHRRRGFAEVGRLGSPGKVVSLMAKEVGGAVPSD